MYCKPQPLFRNLIFMSCVSYCLEKKLNVGISISTLIIFRKKKKRKKIKRRPKLDGGNGYTYWIERYARSPSTWVVESF
jgi:hypothetical protein